MWGLRQRCADAPAQASSACGSARQASGRLPTRLTEECIVQSALSRGEMQHMLCPAAVTGQRQGEVHRGAHPRALLHAPHPVLVRQAQRLARAHAQLLCRAAIAVRAGTAIGNALRRCAAVLALERQQRIQVQRRGALPLGPELLQAAQGDARILRACGASPACRTAVTTSR